MLLCATEILKIVDGKLLVLTNTDKITATNFCIDSNSACSGSIFVAFEGEKTDGHKYILSALQNGASVVFCTKQLDNEVFQFATNKDIALILVKDCVTAMQKVANFWRNKISANVIALTGSTGKTSSKKILYEVLSSKLNTQATYKNLNNEIGVPITICQSSSNDKALIVEMGMRAKGDIKYLCDIVHPNWGLITNIGKSHIEFFGTRENIAKGKAELALAIPENTGKMFLYAEDDFSEYIIQYAKLQEKHIDIIFFGGKCFKQNLQEKYGSLQVWYEDLRFDKNACSSFTLCAKGLDSCTNQEQDCAYSKDIVRVKTLLQLQGKHNVINACAAASVALKMGFTLQECSKALQNCKPETGRQEIIHTKSNITIINDAYNANPDSMQASLNMLHSIECNGRKICVLGDMKELGKYSKSEHENVGKLVTKYNFDYLLCIGPEAKYIYDSAVFHAQKQLDQSDYKSVETNLQNKIDQKYRWTDNLISAEKILKDICKQNDTVLLKASNSMRLSTLIRVFEQGW